MRLSFVFFAVLSGSLTYLLTSASEASTTVVTFDETKGVMSDLRVDRESWAYGIWEEAGFDVAWDYGPCFRGCLASAVGNTLDSPFLADTNVFGEGSYLEFSRPDGRSFSLQSLDVLDTDTSFLGLADFIPYDANGYLDYTRFAREQFNVVDRNIRFSGLREDGSAVTAYASSFYASKGIEQAGTYLDYAGDGTLDLYPSLQTTLSGLTSLRVDLWGAPSSEYSALQQLRDSLEFSELSDLFRMGFEQCDQMGMLLSRCTFSGFGEFSFYIDSGFYHNWNTAVTFDNFRFDVKDGGNDVASIPAPGGLGLLLSALLATGIVRRSRARP